MTGQCSTGCADAQMQRQTQEALLKGRMQHIRHKILVLSGKGGVGKSTVAANLGVALARTGRKVGLLDADLHGPSIPKILGLDGRHLQAGQGNAIEPVQLMDNLSVVSIGLLLRSAFDAVIWRGPMKHNAIQHFLTNVAWGDLDFLVIDSPPGTGDEPLTVAQLVGDGAWAVIVTTPQDVAVADVRRCVSFCRSLSLRIAGIVENMSGLVCPHCGKQVDLFKVGGGQNLATEMGLPYLGRIPIDPQIVISGDAGQPFVQHFAHSPAAEAFARIVGSILSHEEHDAGGTQPQRF
jgi:ATP-binding protein involved in chromosome partitioning